MTADAHPNSSTFSPPSPQHPQQTPASTNTYINKKYHGTFKSKTALEFLLTAGAFSDENEAVDCCTYMVRYGMIANAADVTFPQFTANPLVRKGRFHRGLGKKVGNDEN